MNRFYVYVFLREDRYTPYYVGKGTGHRMYQRTGRVVLPPTDRTRIVKIKDDLLECQSLELEKTLIRFWGREKDGGVLHNLTDGGDGVSGLSEESKKKIGENTRRCLKGRKGHTKGRVVTDETRKKLSVAGTGKKRSVESRVKQSETMKGRKRPPEVVAKMRKTLTGRKLSDEHRRKISESRRKTKSHGG